MIQLFLNILSLTEFDVKLIWINSKFKIIKYISTYKIVK